MVLSITLIMFQAMSPIFASAVVPGWGELIQGEKNKARTFFIIEGGIWLSYFGFNHLGNTVEQSARTFAIQHTGGNPAQRDQLYFDALEDFFSSDDYNLEIERTASVLYPDDPVQQQEYINEHSYVGEDAWEWDTLSNVTTYWSKRREAREHYRRASFMPGFALINRIVSIVDVVVFSQGGNFGLDTDQGRIGLYYKF